MNDLVPNAWGEMVQRSVPNTTPKATQNPPRTKLKSMSTEERRQYNSDRQAKHRAKKKLAEDLLQDREQAVREAQRQEYQPEIVEPEHKPVPKQQQDAFDAFLDQDDSVSKVSQELNRVWLYSSDFQAIRNLQAMVYGVQNKFIQTDNGCVRVLGVCPDTTMSETIKFLQKRPNFNAESNLIDPRKSKTFMALYQDSLWKVYSLINDPKYAPLMGSRMSGEIKQEWQRVCQS
jgi:hypothetical protein